MTLDAAASPLLMVVGDLDDQTTLLTAAFEARSHRVIVASTGSEALHVLDTSTPDLIILDLGLPDIDGLDLFRHVRARCSAPVIVVTAESEEARIVEALDLGADDYITKPYSMSVLMARVRVGLRYSVAPAAMIEERLIEVGDLRIDVDGHQAMVGDEVIEMHPRQFKLLVILARNQGKVLTYSALDRAIGDGGEWSSERNPYRVSMSKIRKQLGSGPRRPTIKTEYNVGYRLVVPDE